MSLFQNFPQEFFSLPLRQKKIVTDIFRRVVLSVPDNTAVILPYVVLDGETPELVSNKLYGNPLYHWVLLIINNIIDVRTEWPLESKFVTPVVYDKYPFYVTCTNTTGFVVNDIVTSSDGGRFIVEDVQTLNLTLRSLRGKTYITTSTTFLRGNTMLQPQILSVLDPEETTHHYIDTRYNLIVDFDPSNPFIEPVSNIDHETTVNEQKRLIRVIDPAQITKVAADFQRAYTA